MGPSILKTTRQLAKETISVSPFLALDAQGMPSYATPIEIEANVVFQGVGEDFVITAAGSKLYAPLVVYVQGDAEYLPLEQDMLEIGSSSGDTRRWIVAERKEPRGLRMQRTQIDHVRLQCRVE